MGFELGDSGVGREYRGLEVVDDSITPLGNGLAHRLAQVGAAAALQPEAGISLAGADVLVGQYLYDYAIG